MQITETATHTHTLRLRQALQEVLPSLTPARPPHTACPCHQAPVRLSEMGLKLPTRSDPAILQNQCPDTPLRPHSQSSSLPIPVVHDDRCGRDTGPLAPEAARARGLGRSTSSGAAPGGLEDLCPSPASSSRFVTRVGADWWAAGVLRVQAK